MSLCPLECFASLLFEQFQDGVFARPLLYAIGFYRMEVRSDRDDWVTFSMDDIDVGKIVMEFLRIKKSYSQPYVTILQNSTPRLLAIHSSTILARPPIPVTICRFSSENRIDAIVIGEILSNLSDTLC